MYQGFCLDNGLKALRFTRRLEKAERRELRPNHPFKFKQATTSSDSIVNGSTGSLGACAGALHGAGAAGTAHTTALRGRGRKSFPTRLTLVMVGDGGVGSTSLAQRFLRGEYAERAPRASPALPWGPLPSPPRPVS